MSKYTTWWGRLLTWLSLNTVAKVEWNAIKALFNKGIYWSLTEEDHDKLREDLKSNYYIILNRRKTHLTTYLISLANLIKTGKFSHYTHALMNVDDGNIRNDNEFKLVEATGTGVHYSSFMKVFDCDSVVLLRPKGFTDENWTVALDGLLKQVGKEYDCLFDVSDDSKLSCIELARRALQFQPDYETRFANFEAMIKKTGNLTPQMLYDCPDFEIVWEVRR